MVHVTYRGGHNPFFSCMFTSPNSLEPQNEFYMKHPACFFKEKTASSSVPKHIISAGQLYIIIDVNLKARGLMLMQGHMTLRVSVEGRTGGSNYHTRH
jgi:hypothetical protein